jgi:polysaccharide export outer membrane protein
MKSAALLIFAMIAPPLLCRAQDQAPAAPPATAQAPPAPAQAGPPVTADNTYIIGSNDVLAVTVWKDTTLSGSVLVRPDGMISIPLVGDVRAAGLTPLHLANEIALKLKKYVQDPNVSVVVTAIHSKVVYMIGEVTRPGPVDLAPRMTLLEAISSAGGLTEFANRKKIYILRDNEGKREKIPVHYKEALQGNRDLDLALKPGDTIVVP